MDLETIISQEASNHPEQISAYRQTGTLFEGGRVVDFIFYFARPHKHRTEIKIDGEVIFAEGFTGEKAWENQEYLLGEEAIALENTADWPNPLRSLDQFREEGHEIELLDTVEDEDMKYYRLRLTLKSGTVRDYYYDTDDLLPRYFKERRKLKMGEKAKNVLTLNEDYREVEGIPFAHHIIDKVEEEDEILVDIQWSHVQLDPVMDEGIFDRESYYTL